MSHGYKPAATAFLISAVVQVIAAILSGGFHVVFLIGALLAVAMATGLNRQLRWVGYLGFALALVWLSVAIAQLGGSAPDWAVWAIVAVNGLAALLTARLLWRPRMA